MQKQKIFYVVFSTSLTTWTISNPTTRCHQILLSWNDRWGEKCLLMCCWWWRLKCTVTLISATFVIHHLHLPKLFKTCVTVKKLMSSDTVWCQGRVIESESLFVTETAKWVWWVQLKVHLNKGFGSSNSGYAEMISSSLTVNMGQVKAACVLVTLMETIFQKRERVLPAFTVTVAASIPSSLRRRMSRGEMWARVWYRRPWQAWHGES